MKKLLYLALVFATAFGFTSCEEKEYERPMDEPDVETYVGTATITGAMPLAPVDNIEVIATFKDETPDVVTVQLPKVSFMPGMMPALNITLPNIPEVSDDLYKAATVTPLMPDGDEFSSVIESVDNVEVKDNDDDTLSLKLDCTVSIQMGEAGAKEMTFKIDYSGKEQ